MKLINCRQTFFITKDGFNKMIFEFENPIPGATIELLGTKTQITSNIVSILIPCVRQDTYTNALLKTPNHPTTIIPILLKPVKKFTIEILCISEAVNTTLLSSHTGHCVYSDDYYTNPDFTALVKSGNIEINAVNSKIHSHLLYGEALVRSLYRIKEIKDLFGTHPETAVISGPSGISSAYTTGLIDAGVKNLIILCSETRNANFPDFFKLFPKNSSDFLNTLIIDEKDSIFKSLTTTCEDTYLFDRISLKKQSSSTLETKIEKAVQNIKDIVPFVSNSPSYTFALCDYLGSTYENPRIKTTTPTKLIDSYKTLYNYIPKLHGEIPDTNAKLTSALRSEAYDARKTMFSIATKETCATLRTIADKTYPFPYKTIKSGYKSISDFFSFDNRCSPDIKKTLFEIEDINPFTKSGKSNSVVTIINPTPYKRYNTINSENINPYQASHHIGSKLFKSKTQTIKADTPSFNIGCYSVSYNPTNGKIISITDKADMRELIDYNSNYRLGDCIFKDKVSQISDYTITKYENTITITYESEGKTSITFYKNSKNIDINLTPGYHNKDFFVAFPLKCDDCDFYTENNNIITSELNDRLRINPCDFSVVSLCGIIDNGIHGFAVITPYAPIIYYGDISKTTPNQYCNHTSSLFVYGRQSEIKIRLFPYSGSMNKALMPSMDFIHPLIISNDYLTLNSKITIHAENIILVTFKPAEDNNGFILRMFEVRGKSTESTVTMPFKISKVYYDNIIEENLTANTTFEKNKIKFSIKASCYTTLRIIPDTKHNKF